jgi:hypothetical protein
VSFTIDRLTSLDLVISDGGVNLCRDKPSVLSKVFRV